MASRKRSGSGSASKPVTKSSSRSKAGAKDKSSSARKGEKVVLLSGGNPQIAKADGDAPVQAYIAAMPEWKRDVGKRVDALVVKSVPKARKAVKWNSPFYGIEGQGWFLSFHVFTRYVKVTFFQGASLRPVPPGASKDKNVRYYDIHEGELQRGSRLRPLRLPRYIATNRGIRSAGPILAARRVLEQGGGVCS